MSSNHLAGGYLLNRYDRALSSAPERVRRALVLYASGYSMLEIADSMQMTYGALTAAVSRFRARFIEREGYVKQSAKLCVAGRKQAVDRASRMKRRYENREKFQERDRKYNEEHREKRAIRYKKRLAEMEREKEERRILRRSEYW